MFFLSLTARRKAIGRGGDPYKDFSRLCPGAKIVVVGGMGVVTPYEIVSGQERRKKDGLWVIRLHPLMSGRGYVGHYGLVNLGILPHNGRLPTWSQVDFTFELACFAELYAARHIRIRHEIDLDDLLYVAHRLKLILEM